MRPAETVTFLFTDIEGSIALWEKHPEAMESALEAHDEIVRAAIETHGGAVFASGGDGFASVFGRADAAVVAAVDAQVGLTAKSWPEGHGCATPPTVHRSC